MTRPQAHRPRVRWGAIPRLVRDAPPRVVLLVGVATAAVGILIVTRPLTSLMVLAFYVGLSAIVAGVFELAAPRAAGAGWVRALSLAWIVGGVAVIVFFGRSLDALPTVIAVLLVLGALQSFGDAVIGGRVAERVLAAAWGAAQLSFGILALTWPDVTVLVAAFAFGIRTVVAGVALAIGGVRALAARHAGLPAPADAPGRAAVRWADAGRVALAVVLVTTSAAAWWADDVLADGAPVVDAFYDPPAELPDEHGMLIRADEYGGRLPPGARVHRILYTTIDARSAPAVASALVIVPEQVSFQPRPVVLWNHGTTGVARGCAPSLREDAATKWAIPALDEAIARGWAVVAPDYTGQGAPGVFPYLIGEGEARSALDAVLAAGQVDGAWLSSRVVVWGHSQGGHAALWAARTAPDYAPQLHVLGVAGLAPAADPHALAVAMSSFGASPLLSILTSWVLVPYSDTYPDVRLSDYVAPGARAIVREMSARCPSEPGALVSLLSALGVSEDRPLYVGDLTDGALGVRLAQNAAEGPWHVPILLAWGAQDEVIPPGLQEGFARTVCEAGEQVRWSVYRGVSHQGILLPRSGFLPLLTAWTADRFGAGRLPVDDCARYDLSP